MTAVLRINIELEFIGRKLEFIWRKLDDCSVKNKYQIYREEIRLSRGQNFWLKYEILYPFFSFRMDIKKITKTWSQKFLTKNE